MTIIKKFDTEEIKPSRLSKKYIVLSIFGLFSLVMLEIWVSNTTVTYGQKFESLQAIRKNLTQENRILENQIAQGSSLSTIASSSASLGFSKLTNIQYIR